MAEPSLQVILGVDTHAQVHVACLLDHLGRLQGTLTIPATQAGSQQLLAWAGRHGRLTHAGVEGTGTYGAGLARFLTAAGVKVIEVDRPNRQRRRRRGKSDPTDAEAAARAVLAGEATATPRPAAASSRPSGYSAPPAQAPSRPAPRPPTSSATCWSPRPRSCTPSCTRCRPPGASPTGGPAARERCRPGQRHPPRLCHLARRHRALTAELDARNTDLATSPAALLPGCWPATASGWRPPASCWSPPGTTRNGSAPTPRWPRWAAPAPWRRPQARPSAAG
jgi:transposase